MRESDEKWICDFERQRMETKRPMRKVSEERIARYRKAYPDDKRSDWLILELLNQVKKDKRYLDRWIMRQVYEGVLSEKKLRE